MESANKLETSSIALENKAASTSEVKKKKVEVIVYDVEVAPNMFMVGCLNRSSGELVVLKLYKDRERDINQLDEILELFGHKDRFYCGFNNRHYDDRVIAFIQHNSLKFKRFTTTKVVEYIYNFSKKLFDEEARKRIRVRAKFLSIDIMSLLKIGKNKKALKLLAVNIGWPYIQDLVFKPDDPVLYNELDLVEEYNINDVMITNALYETIIDDIRLRGQISRQYKVNVMSSSNSAMSGVLLDKMYAKRFNKPFDTFKGLRTPRAWMTFDDIINDKIKFQTPQLQALLQSLKGSPDKGGEFVSPDTKFKRTIRIGRTWYDIAKGGLHSTNHQAIIYEESTDIEIWDVDVRSYYPRNMINHKIYPAHLDEEFLLLLEELTDKRIAAKEAGDKITAEALKITINSIFGKLNYDGYWLYDPLALYQVTVNGQLFLLMLIEALEMAGIPVFYANTDGITAQVPKNKVATFKAITEAWEKYTTFELEHTRFKKFIVRDVNNYLVVKSDGGTKGKGALDKDNLIHPTITLGLMKGFKHPIVGRAVHEYFVNGTPVYQTIREETDVLQFCLAQKVGGNFTGVYFQLITKKNNKVTKEMSRTNRYFACVPRYGGSLYKQRANGTKIALLAKQKVVMVNNLDEFNDEYGDLPLAEVVDLNFYVQKAGEIIALFRSTQLDIFDDEVRPNQIGTTKEVRKALDR